MDVGLCQHACVCVSQPCLCSLVHAIRYVYTFVFIAVPDPHCNDPSCARHGSSCVVCVPTGQCCAQIGLCQVARCQDRAAFQYAMRQAWKAPSSIYMIFLSLSSAWRPSRASLRACSAASLKRTPMHAADVFVAMLLVPHGPESLNCGTAASPTAPIHVVMRAPWPGRHEPGGGLRVEDLDGACPEPVSATLALASKASALLEAAVLAVV